MKECAGCKRREKIIASLKEDIRALLEAIGAGDRELKKQVFKKKEG